MMRKNLAGRFLSSCILFAVLLTAATISAFAQEDVFNVRDILAGTGNSNPTGLTVLGSKAYFSAASSGTNTELWMSDGTNAGTVLVQEIRAGATGSGPATFASTGTYLFFSANDGTNGIEPYASTGVAGNATLLMNIAPGATGSAVANPTVAGSLVYFTANDSSTGTELYVTNGTAAGTLRPKDIYTGANNSAAPGLLTALGNLVIFEATDGSTGIEPYVSDGTNAGTFRLADIRTGAGNSSDPTDMVAVPALGLVFFDANAAGTIGRELYKTNGTSAGTALVTNINTGANNANPINLASGLGKLFFSADSGANGIEPYVTDGTAGGTIQLANLAAGGNDSNPYGFTEAGTKVYFGADGANGIELYATDGTTGGTALVENIRTGGTGDSTPSNLTAFGNKLFFTADDGSGQEPWISDGTTGGTFELRDIRAGGTTSSVANIVVTTTYVYFTADDGTTGREWWRTNGTTAGTIQVSEVRTGTTSAAIAEPVVAGDYVLFSATNGTTNPQVGQELWGIEYNMPSVTSIVRASADPTNAASVSFTVTFSENVTGVNTGDFAVAATGVTGASVSSVTQVTASTYTVVVSTGTGSGTLGLNLSDNDSIRDTQGSVNPLGGSGNNNGDLTGETYTIDRTAPAVSSSVLGDPSPTNASSVTFDVTFSENVTGVGTADFSLTTTGLAGYSIASVTQNTASTYTVTVNTGTGNGTLRLNVTDDDTIQDSLGNRLGGTGAGNGNYTAGQTYTVDRTSPSVSSIVRAGTDPTSAASVNFTVTFNENVTGVNTSDFALTTTGVSGASVSSVTQVTASTYTVAVATGSGSGTIRLDLADDDSVMDTAGNPLGGTGAGNGSFTSGQAYTVDRTPPTVASIVRVGASPTNAGTVSYTVTFSENVTGVNNADFTLATSGVTGTSVASTTQVTASTYTVVVNTGSGSGTIRLDLTDNDSIQDTLGNRLGGTGNGNGNFASGETYTIDKTGPTVLSSVRAGADPSASATVAFTVTFSENVTGVNNADFSLTTSGVAGTSIASVAQVTADVYTVTVNTGTGSGTIRLNFTDNDSVIDGLGNPAGGAGAGNANYTAGETYTIDRTGPTVSSINRADTDPTSAASVDFTVTFSENVTGVNAADFTLTQTGGVTGATVGTVTQVTASTYAVAVNTGSGAGTLRLNFVDDDSVADSLGNKAGGTGAGNANYSTGQVYTIDRTAPTVSSIVRAGTNPSAAATVTYTVTFSETVTGVDTTDFVTTPTGLTGTSVASVTPVSGTVYTVTVNTGSGNGTLRLDLSDDDSISDTAGNPLAGAGAGNGDFTTGQSYTIDRQPPTVSSIVRVGASPTNAASVSYTVTFSENVTGVGTSDFTLTTSGVTGTSITSSTQVTASTYTVVVNTGSGSGTIRLDLTDNDSIQDTLGNRLGGTGNGNGNFTAGEVYTLDRTAPAVSSIVRADANPTGAASVAFTVTFSENVTGVNNGDFTLNVSGVTGSSVTGVVPVSASVYTVNVNTGTGSGTIRLDFVDNNSVTDSAGNATAAGFTTGQSYTVDRTGPAVSSINRVNADPTASSTVSFLVTFNEAATGVDAGDFSLNATGVTGASISGVTQNTTSTYTVTVNTGSGSGSLRVDFVDNDTVLDSFGNSSGGTGNGNGNYSSGQSYTVDRTGPVVQSSVRLSGNPTTANSVWYWVTIDESVNGLDASDLTLTTTGTLSGTSITSVTPIIVNTLFLVVVNTGTGSGTLRLDITDNDTVTDALGNPMGGPGNNNGNFTTGEVYTVDRTAPTVSSIVRANANPTNNASVNFTVTFSEDVTGVGTADFTLNTSGVTGTSITSVTQVTASTYTVAVNTGSGSGTIRLDVTDDDSIRDTVTNRLGGTGNGNGNYSGGEIYTVDRVAPTVSSINRADSNPTGANSVAFTVTFSEAVTGVDTSDFNLTTTGVSGASVSSVSQVNTSTYTVNVATGTGSGTIRLNLTDDDSVRDLATNRLGGTGAGNGNFTTGQQYTIDKAVPTVSSIARQDANPTNAAAVSYLVTFSENVSGVDTGDFAITTTGSLSGAAVASVTQTTASTYTVSVNTGSGEGTLRLDFSDNDSVLDTASNPTGGAGAGNANFTTGEVYSVDRTAPVVASVVRAGTNPTNAASVDFTVTFSEDVTGVGVNDFVLTTTGVTGASVTSRTQVTASTYTVTVSTGTGAGTLRLDVSDDDSIKDGANNALGGTGAGNGNFTTGEVYTVDKTSPTVLSIDRAGTDPTNAASVDFTVTFSEDVTGVNASDFTLTTTGITGASVTSRTLVSPSVYTVHVNTGSGDGTVRLNLADDDSISDSAGNTLGGTGVGNGNFSTGQTYTIDKSAPAVTSVVRVDSNPTNASSVEFDVTISEAISGVDASDLTLTTTGLTGVSITGVTQNAPNSYRVAVNTGTGDGTIRLDVVDDDSIVDVATNPLGGTGAGNGGFTTGETYTVDKTAPVVASIVRADSNPSNAATVSYTVTFTEDVTGVGVNDFTLTTTGVTGASIASRTLVTQSVYTVVVNTGTGSGTIRLDLADNDSIIDAQNNSLGGTGAGNGDFTTGEVYTLDRTAPSVLSIVRADANPSNAATIHFTVTFSEDVTGVNASDFVLTTSGISGASVVSRTLVSPSVYTVNVNSGTGSGTIRLNLIDNDSIIDSLSTPLGGSGLVNGDFTAGEAYTIDRTAPVVTAITRVDPNPTSATSVSFDVQFSEDVTGFDASDLSLHTTGISGVSVTGVVQGAADSYRVTVNTGTGPSGTLRLDVTDNDSVVDGAGNPLGGTGTGNGDFTTGQSYMVSRIAPVVSSITRADSNPTNAASVNFTVSFSVDVTGVDTGDFALTTSGVAGASVTSVTQNTPANYSVAVATGTGSGTIRLDLEDDDTIMDSFSTRLGGAGTGNGDFTAGEVYTIDASFPVVVSMNRVTPNPMSGSTATFRTTFSANVTGVGTDDFALDVTGLTGSSITGVNAIDGMTYDVTVNTGTGDGTLKLLLVDNDTILNALGTALGGVGSGNGDFNAGETFTVDRTGPAVTISGPSPANTMNGPVSYAVNFTGAASVALTPGMVTLHQTGTATGTVNVSGSGNTTRTVTITGITGDGTLSISIAANAAADSLSNQSLAAGPSAQVAVSSTAPSVPVNPYLMLAALLLAFGAWAFANRKRIA